MTTTTTYGTMVNTSKYLFSIGTPLRCNQCDGRFKAPDDVFALNCFTAITNDAGTHFSTEAVRLTSFMACPVCKVSDCHWIYASDLDKAVRLIDLSKASQKKFEVGILNSEPPSHTKDIIRHMVDYTPIAWFVGQGDAFEYATMCARRYSRSSPWRCAVVIT